MKIANGVEVLDLTANLMGRQSMVHPTLIWDDENVVLVDAGFPKQIEEIRAGMEKAGVPLEKVTKIILTHQDIDHVGGLPDILRAVEGKVEVIAHEVEKPYISGEKTPIKLAKLEENKDVLSEDMKMFYQKLKAGFEYSKTNIDRTVVDGDVLPYCGGITVIYTPGHTMGHICLYHNLSKTLIAGDALVIINGQLLGPSAQVTADMGEAVASLKKLTEYDIETVICYHGGIFQDNNINAKIERLAKAE